MKLLRNKAFMLFSLGLMIYLLLSSYPVMASNEQYDTVDSYEENMFLPAYDIYVNQTAPAFLSLNGLQSPFQIVHYMIFPDSVSMEDLVINDPSVRVRFGAFGVNMDTLIKSGNTNLGLNTLEDKTEAGNSAFANRETDRIENDDMSDSMGDGAGVIYDTIFDQWNTETMSTLTQNYTVPNTKVTGVSYEANDDKTIVEYGQDISEADGGTYHNIVNASMIGFAFDDYDNLEAVTWAFDEEGSGALSLSGFSIKRARVWLHSAKYKTQSRWSSVKRSVDQTIFKPIKNAGSTLGAIPSKTKHFFKKTIPTAFHSVISKVGSMAKGIIGALKGLLPIILLILIILALWYFGMLGRFSKGR